MWRADRLYPVTLRPGICSYIVERQLFAFPSAVKAQLLLWCKLMRITMRSDSCRLSRKLVVSRLVSEMIDLWQEDATNWRSSTPFRAFNGSKGTISRCWSAVTLLRKHYLSLWRDLRHPVRKLAFFCRDAFRYPLFLLQRCWHGCQIKIFIFGIGVQTGILKSGGGVWKLKFIALTNTQHYVKRCGCCACFGQQLVEVHKKTC